MSEFSACLTEANRALGEIFADPVIVKVDATEALLQAIFFDPTKSNTTLGFELRENQPFAVFTDAAAFAETGTGPGDILVIEPDRYEIVGPPEYDDGGMVTVRLRKLP